MDRLRKIGAKIKNRRNDGGKSKTLRHSRSMPFRNSSETDYSASTSSRPSKDFILDIRGSPEWPSIPYKVGHRLHCECYECKNALDDPPSTPPMRPRVRPRDLSQDFDDVLLLPDSVYEARKKQRDVDKKEEEERQKVYDTLSAYRVKAASNKSFRDPVDVTPEEYEILCQYHPLFRLGGGGVHGANRSTRSLGAAQVHYVQGPISKRPDVVTISSRAATGYRTQVYDTNGDAASVRSYSDAGSVHSLRPQGKRNLQGQPIIARSTSDSSSMRSSRTRMGHSNPNSLQRLPVASSSVSDNSSVRSSRARVGHLHQDVPPGRLHIASRSTSDSASMRSFRPRNGFSNLDSLQRPPIISNSVSDNTSARSFRLGNGQSHSHPPISYKETASLRSRRIRDASPSPSDFRSPSRSGHRPAVVVEKRAKEEPVLVQHVSHGGGRAQPARRMIASKGRDLPVVPTVSSNPYPPKF